MEFIILIKQVLWWNLPGLALLRTRASREVKYGRADQPIGVYPSCDF